MEGILQKPWLINMPPYDPDPQIIEKSLHELEFILNWIRQDCLRKIPENRDAIEKYHGMDQEKVQDTIERLLQLIE